MRRSILLFVLALGLMAPGFSGCTGAVVIRPTPAPVVVTTAPPARVYHHGRWLHYRSNGYYYYHSGAWLAAPAVPTHVTHYHRPTVVHHRRTYRRPVHRTRVYHHRRHKVDVARDAPPTAELIE